MPSGSGAVFCTILYILLMLQFLIVPQIYSSDVSIFKCKSNKFFNVTSIFECNSYIFFYHFRMYLNNIHSRLSFLNVPKIYSSVAAIFNMPKIYSSATCIFECTSNIFFHCDIISNALPSTGLFYQNKKLDEVKASPMSANANHQIVPRDSCTVNGRKTI